MNPSESAGCRGPGIVGVVSGEILERLTRFDATLERGEAHPRILLGIRVRIRGDGYEDVGDLTLLRGDEALPFGFEQGAELVVVRLDARCDLVPGDLQVSQAQPLRCHVLVPVLLEVRRDLGLRGLRTAEVGRGDGQQRKRSLLQPHAHGVAQLSGRHEVRAGDAECDLLLQQRPPEFFLEPAGRVTLGAQPVLVGNL